MHDSASCMGQSATCVAAGHGFPVSCQAIPQGFTLEVDAELSGASPRYDQVNDMSDVIVQSTCRPQGLELTENAMAMLEDTSSAFPDGRGWKPGAIGGKLGMSDHIPLRPLTVPRSITRGTEVGSEQVQNMRMAAMQAAQEAALAAQEREVREEKLRQQIKEMRAVAEQRKIAVEEERRRREQVAVREREAREQALRDEQERRSKQEQAAAEKVAAFLTSFGLTSVKEAKRSSLKKSYPLHLAVEKNDADMVLLLLQAGADPSQKNFFGQTPQQMAKRRNYRGSHDKVLSMLGAL